MSNSKNTDTAAVSAAPTATSDELAEIQRVLDETRQRLQEIVRVLGEDEGGAR